MLGFFADCAEVTRTDPDTLTMHGKCATSPHSTALLSHGSRGLNERRSAAVAVGNRSRFVRRDVLLHHLDPPLELFVLLTESGDRLVVESLLVPAALRSASTAQFTTSSSNWSDWRMRANSCSRITSLV